MKKPISLSNIGVKKKRKKKVSNTSEESRKIKDTTTRVDDPKKKRRKSGGRRKKEKEKSLYKKKRKYTKRKSKKQIEKVRYKSNAKGKYKSKSSGGKSKSKSPGSKNQSRSTSGKTKSSLKTKFRRTYKYHKKKVTSHLGLMLVSPNVQKHNKEKIQKYVYDFFNMVEFVMENNIENQEYLDCIREKLRKVERFFTKLAKYDYSFGKYLHEEDFDEFIQEENVIANHSIKVGEVLENAKKMVETCDKYLYKDQ